MKGERAFTMVELVVVMLIGAILAAIFVPMMRGRTETAKWAEANASAGAIRTAIRACVAEKGMAEVQKFAGTNMGSAETRSALGFASTDLQGTYFEPDDYTITSINANGIAAVTVTGGSKPDSPGGVYQLDTAGNWLRQ